MPPVNSLIYKDKIVGIVTETVSILNMAETCRVILVWREVV